MDRRNEPHNAIAGGLWHLGADPVLFRSDILDKGQVAPPSYSGRMRAYLGKKFRTSIRLEHGLEWPWEPLVPGCFVRRLRS
jgi:hypothetical protein